METRRALRTLVRPHGALAAASAVVLLAGTVAGLLGPPLLGRIVDLVIDGQPASAVTGPVLGLVGVAVAQGALAAAGAVLVARLGETMLAVLRERVVDRVLAVPLDVVERAGTGDLLARVGGDVSVVSTAVREAFPALMSSGLTVGLTVVGLAALDWRLALAGLCAAPIQAHTLRWYLRRSAPLYAAERIAQGERAHQLHDSIDGAATVRAFRLAASHVTAVAERSRAAVALALRATALRTRFFGRLNLAEFVGLSAILVTGFVLVRAGTVSVGVATAAALYFHRLFDPINVLLYLFDEAQSAAAALARLVGVGWMDAPAEIAGTGDATAGGVEVDRVIHAYVAGHDVLHDVSLRIDPGERVAVVGASGAGKTTLAKLVAGLHQPSAGRVLVGGPVALVTQEIHVFAGTLADDLRLARPKAADSELTAVLGQVGALGWAQALPQGLDTVVGDGGHRLTATQAQQLALARLLLAGPLVAILDEATAEAGSSGAKILEAAAANALKGRTALVVAHRLTQAASADRIIVLSAGRVVETGTHAQLIAAGGRYAALWATWSGNRTH
ncbi:MAG: ABC transporter ATP-binding protein [Egibacteraceae bacterium]